jgi:hypothetical protein
MQGKRALQVGVLLAVAAALTLLGGAMPGGGRVVTHQRVPEFRDWSTRHVVYSNWGYFADVNMASSDPRAIFSWRARSESMHYRFPPSAKYSFDVTQAPSCANDYVVFPIAAPGSSTQPNLVAFNQLYSGTAGVNGICNRTASGSDLGTTATVYWSYNVQGIAGGGAVPTSPVISFDPNNSSNTGTEIAFVESIAGSAAHFHVLAFKTGDGVVATNLQYVLTPTTISSFTVNAPLTGSGTATDLALGSSTSGTDSLSSPFVDYVRDVAYVGNDLGVLYRIKDVFCTSVNADCKGGTNPAPSLDTSWGTGGAVTVCGGTLTGPVLDFVTLNVYVGCSDGNLYSVSQTGTVKSLAVGDGAPGKTYGGIVDPPLVDGVNGFVYAVSGSGNSGGYGVLVQAKMDLSSPIVAQIGAGNQCNMHAPVFNNTYYTSPTTAGALIYVAGVTGTVSQPCSVSSTVSGDIFVYGVTFGATGTMTAGTPADNVNLGGGPGAEWAPLLEFYNATTAADSLFVAALQSSQTNMATANIASAFPATSAFNSFVEYGLGLSGMIVDNNSASAQAASIYFNAQGENTTCSNNAMPSVLTDTGGCAVKLSQVGLQ